MSYRCQGCGKTSRIAAHDPGCPVAAAFDSTPPTVVNPSAIGDPNQTPVVYIRDAGKALGIPERSGVDLEDIRERAATFAANSSNAAAAMDSADDVPALIADLDAARQERDEARATLSIVEANFRELETERDRMRPVVEKAIAARRAWWPMPPDLDAAVDTYETQTGDGA